MLLDELNFEREPVPEERIKEILAFFGLKRSISNISWAVHYFNNTPCGELAQTMKIGRMKMA